jgi:hypothetical protein
MATKASATAVDAVVELLLRTPLGGLGAAFGDGARVLAGGAFAGAAVFAAGGVAAVFAAGGVAAVAAAGAAWAGTAGVEAGAAEGAGAAEAGVAEVEGAAGGGVVTGCAAVGPDAGGMDGLDSWEGSGVFAVMSSLPAGPLWNDRNPTRQVPQRQRRCQRAQPAALPV